MSLSPASMASTCSPALDPKRLGLSVQLIESRPQRVAKLICPHGLAVQRQRCSIWDDCATTSRAAATGWSTLIRVVLFESNAKPKRVACAQSVIPKEAAGREAGE